MEINQVQMSNWRFGIVVVVIIGKPPLMGEVLCSTENSPFLIIDHIHAKINRVCCAALAIGKKCMNVRKNKLLKYESSFLLKLKLVSLYTYFCLSTERETDEALLAETGAFNAPYGNQVRYPTCLAGSQTGTHLKVDE